MDTEKRPSEFSEAVDLKIATKVLKILRQWNSDFDSDVLHEGETDAEFCEKRLAPALKFVDDSYEAAKEIERTFYVDADGSLVDLLGALPFFRNEIHRELVSEWVRKNSVQSTMVLNSRVIVTEGMFKNHAGEIVKIENDLARYHVKLDEKIPQGMIHGNPERDVTLIVPYEDVRHEATGKKEVQKDG